jgi:hypothetical protein
LDLDGGLYCLDRACEFGDNIVARAAEDTSAVRDNDSVRYFAMNSQRSESAFLVYSHKPAIAGNIGHKDRRKFAFHGQRPGVCLECD